MNIFVISAIEFSYIRVTVCLIKDSFILKQPFSHFQNFSPTTVHSHYNIPHAFFR